MLHLSEARMSPSTAWVPLSIRQNTFHGHTKQCNIIVPYILLLIFSDFRPEDKYSGPNILWFFSYVWQFPSLRLASICFLYWSWFVCVCVYLCMLCVCACVYLCMLCVCVCVGGVYICVCVWYMCVWCVCLCGLYVCVCGVYVFVCVCGCVCGVWGVCVGVCVCVCVCVALCLCVCVCVCVCVWVVWFICINFAFHYYLSHFSLAVTDSTVNPPITNDHYIYFSRQL